MTRPTATKLRGMGIQTVRDLVFLFATRHVDYSALRRIAEVVEGEEQTVVGALWEANEVQMGANRRTRATVAVIGDETGNLRLVWFQQPWVAANLRRAAGRAAAGAEHMRFSVSGKVSVFNGRRQMDNPEWEAVDDPETSELVNTGRLLPVYPSTKDLYQKTLRRIVRDALNAVDVDGQPAVDDPLPDGLAEKLGLWPLPRAVAQAHYPDSHAAFEEARRRLAFDEFFVLQLAVAARRSRPASETPGIVLASMPGAGASVHTFVAVRAHRGTARGARRRDGRRGRRRAADEPSPAGGRGQRQDRGRAGHAAHGGRRRPSGRHHGPDRGARRAALPQRPASAQRRSPAGLGTGLVLDIPRRPPPAD